MAVCGTRACYVGGCRCPDCVQANSDYHRDHRWPTGRNPGLPRIRLSVGGRSWVRRAACAGHGHADWFADDPSGKYPAARAVCDDCAVKAECLAWAIEARVDHGMWGGLNPTERTRYARRSRRQAGTAHVEELVLLVFLIVFITVGLRLVGLGL